MEQITLKQYFKYFFIICFIGIILLSFYLIKPFISSILAAIFLTYIFFPIQKILRKKVKRKNLCSLLMILIVIIIIFVPLIFALNTVTNEIIQIYGYVKTNQMPDAISVTLQKIIGKSINTDLYIQRLTENIVPTIVDMIPNLFLYLPTKIINFFIVVFTMFYLFRDGEEMLKNLEKKLPLKRTYKKRLFKKFSDVTYAVVYGHIITAIIQGLIGALGFFIFGISSPLLWGIVMTIFGLLPFIGTPFVWVPVGIFQLFQGNWFSGIGILLYGAIIISSIDNIIKPKLISTKADIHPIFILLGVIGGLKMFGLIGLVIGPLILATLMVFLDLQKGEKLETQS